MLMPKRTKWRRQMRGRIRGEATRGNTVAFGEFGLQAIEPGWVSARVIEAGRIAAGRNAPEGKVWIRIF
ncbi:MAG: 50S ribosomal protein L16, partial [Planctomycetes bacterium]|nr:50S ribosomal protein L16 [Planctomycetota bacterium]